MWQADASHSRPPPPLHRSFCGRSSWHGLCALGSGLALTPLPRGLPKEAAWAIVCAEEAQLVIREAPGRLGGRTGGHSEGVCSLNESSSPCLARSSARRALPKAYISFCTCHLSKSSFPSS